MASSTRALAWAVFCQSSVLMDLSLVSSFPRDLLHLVALLGGEFGSRTGEQVEDDKFLLGEPLPNMARLLLGQRLAQRQQLQEELVD